MHPQTQTMVGVRIPANLKKRLSSYCVSRGIKLNFFITEAIAQHLEESAQDHADVLEAKKRLANADYSSETEMASYLKKRGIK